MNYHFDNFKVKLYENHTYLLLKNTLLISITFIFFRFVKLVLLLTTLIYRL